MYDQVTGGVIFHCERSFLTDGHKSFPSGHTSLKFLPLISAYLCIAYTLYLFLACILVIAHQFFLVL
jgi:membrane-associated phospholipid phosphatase